MIGKIFFQKDGVISISLPGDPISVHHYGGVKFGNNSPVLYRNVGSKQLGAFHAYLIVLPDTKKAVLFDEEPTYNKKDNCYTSFGMSIPLDIESEEIDPEFTPDNLIVLHAI